MGIAHIIGGKGTGKSFTANSFRAQGVNLGRGTLLIDDHLKDDGATAILLEKIIADGDEDFLNGKRGRLTDTHGKPKKETFDIATINWKNDPVIIFVGDAIERLADIEKMVPGFTKKFGPVRQLNMGDVPYIVEEKKVEEAKP